MTGTRTKNTKRNIELSLLDSFATMFFQFISRSVIVHVFSSQYIGLNGLFSSMLSVLNMADLGFSTAIVFNMYKPIAEGDSPAVCALLNLYKKIYRIVGVVILLVGLALMPFIPHLINGNYPAEINIYILYFIYVLNCSLSYMFFAYKSALLNALQRLDLTKLAYISIHFLQYSLQIIAIVVLKNFYIFSALMILGTALKNIVCEFISTKKYPEYGCCGEVSAEVLDDIKIRVKGLLIGNIGGVTYTAIDSIILSKFFGLDSVAVYNNYILIFNGVLSYVALVRNAMQASVGNSIATETQEKNHNDLIIWQFLFSCIAIWCATCMMSLYQPFMSMWMGENMLLTMVDVSLLCIWCFLSTVSHVFYLYLSGSGLWWELRWTYILSTIFNLLCNIGLGWLMGITGIILSSLLSIFLFSTISQCSKVFKFYFSNYSFTEYFLKQLCLLATGVLSCLVAFVINERINLNGALGLVVRVVICTAVAITVIVMIYRNTKVYKNAKKFISTAIKI